MVNKKAASQSTLRRRAPGTEATISTLANELEDSKAIEVTARHLERKFLQCAEALKVDLNKIKDESGHYGHMLESYQGFSYLKILLLSFKRL